MRTLCNGIAFYDFNPELFDVEGWHTYCVQWFESHGLPPGSMGLPGKSKLLQFKSGQRQLQKKGFEGILDLSVLCDVSELGTNLDWRGMTGFRLERKTYAYFCFDDAAHSFTFSHIFSLAEALARFCPFRYGFAYQREFKKGPDCYILGAGGGDPRARISDKEDNQIAEWMEVYSLNGRYRTGLLRDVYPFNFLTVPHLQQIVQGHSFEEWVGLDPAHGTLHPLSATQWMWAVEEAHIPAVQEILEKAGLLLCYKPVHFASSAE